MKPSLRQHYAPDNASLIVRLALEELGVPYDTVLVDRAAQAQRSPAYLRLNPHGLIPTLETPDGPIFETGAILLWLADGHEALAPPPDSPDRAGLLKWLFFTSNTLHAAMRMLFYTEKYIGPDPQLQKALRRQTQANLKTHLTALEGQAAARQSWFNGPSISLLDLYVPCLMRWMALYPKGDTDWFDITATPHLHALAARIETRDSARRAAQAEGLGPTPFSAPTHANPPEGSAT